MRNMELKNDIIYCIGEWEIIRPEEEQDEDENDRFTNKSFLNEEIYEFFSYCGSETIVEKLPQNIS